MGAYIHTYVRSYTYLHHIHTYIHTYLTYRYYIHNTYVLTLHTYTHTYINKHEKCNDLYHSANISRVIEIRIMKRPGHVARIAELRNTYKNWVGKPTT